MVLHKGICTKPPGAARNRPNGRKQVNNTLAKNSELARLIKTFFQISEPRGSMRWLSSVLLLVSVIIVLWGLLPRPSYPREIAYGFKYLGLLENTSLSRCTPPWEGFTEGKWVRLAGSARSYIDSHSPWDMATAPHSTIRLLLVTCTKGAGVQIVAITQCLPGTGCRRDVHWSLGQQRASQHS